MTAASNDVEYQAARRLIQIESDGTPDNWARLDGWLCVHPRNRAAFLRLSLAWNRADRLAQLRKAATGIDEDLLSASRARAAHSPPRRALLAAAAAVTLAVAGLQFLHRDAVTAETHETATGQVSSFALADGSRVALNTGSRLLVRYGDRQRELALLHGEVALDVRADAHRPFVLRAGHTTFRVLGTSFSVRVFPDGHVEIAVSEGRVALDSDGVLSAGEVATIRGATVLKRRVPLELLAQKLAWTHGRLFFDGETLSAAATEFNRYNRVQLQIADRDVGAVRIFGTFEADEPQMFVAALEEPFGISPNAVTGRRGEKVIRLERRGT